MDIKNKAQFIEYFSKGIKSSNQLKIGVEHERFLFEGKIKKRITYSTLKKLFENLKNSGWQPIFEKENAFGWFNKYDQIAIIDADVYIREDAPDFFQELESDYDFGGVVEKDMPINISNVAFFDTDSGKGARIGYSFNKDGKKVRINKKSGKEI